MDDLLEQLETFKFDKYLKKLNRKLKNKTVVIYGAGLLFNKIIENYDLSNLNVIGISDRKFEREEEGQEAFGYKIIPLEKIKDYNPDYILISTINYMPILDDFVHNLFKKTKIKVLPLVDKPFLVLLKEIFR